MIPTGLWLKRLCAVCLILLMQGPAMLVQEVAWATMLFNYSREKGLARGLVETFDGKHPCKMCAKAEDLRKSEGKGDPMNAPQEKKPVRLAWGEMVKSSPLELLDDPGTDCVMQPPPAIFRTPGRGKDSPGLPPPERV